MAETVPVADLLQYGILGLVVLALISGWLWPKPAVQAKDEEIKRLTDRVNRLESEIVPLIREFYGVAVELSKQLHEAHIPELARLIEALRRTLERTREP